MCLITFEVKDLVAEMTNAEILRLEHERSLRKMELNKLQKTAFRCVALRRCILEPPVLCSFGPRHLLSKAVGVRAA